MSQGTPAELEPVLTGEPALAGEAAVAAPAPVEPQASVEAAQTSPAAALRIRRDKIFRRALLLADVVAFALALGSLALLTPERIRLDWAPVAGLLTLVLCAKVIGLYDRDEAVIRKTSLEEAPKLFQLATLAALGAWLAGGVLFVGGVLDRGEALLLWIALFGWLIFARSAARALALRLAPAERCLFIGDSVSARTIRAKLGEQHGLKANLVLTIDPEDAVSWSAAGFGAPRLSEIRDLARSLDVQRAIIAPDSVKQGQLLDLICTLKALGVKVSMLPRMLEVVGSSVEFDDLHGVTLMGVRRFALNRSSTLVKRCFDLVAALLGILVVSPALIAIAIAIKLDSRGPVLFRQRRVGLYGDHFEVLKFRTMVDGADGMKESLRHRNEAREGLFKIADDPRVTGVGRWLRKSALDELPQLFNIVRGEMSLVGPRPLVLDEDQRVTGWYRRRLELMPGMTGPWQILGPARVPLSEMGAIDYLYVANWSLWGDLKILLRTVPHVVGRHGL